MQVEIAKLKSMKEELYPRTGLDQNYVNSLVKAIEAGAVLPPLIVDSKTYMLVDGYNRLEAYKKLGITEVEATLKPYLSEQEMYLDAIEINSQHGKRLTTFEKAQCLATGIKLHIAKDKLIKALQISEDYADRLLVTRSASDGTILKTPLIHLAGEKTTKKQREFNKRAGGNIQTFYLNQVVGLLESGSLNMDNENIISKLYHLQELLNGMLTERKVG